MVQHFFVIIEIDQPGTGCSYARCSTPDTGSYLVEDNTGVRKPLCIHCLAALLKACQPSPAAAVA